MSVTFRPQNCPEIEGPYGPEPEYWCNFSNGNAVRILDIAGLPVDCSGDCPVEDLFAVSQRLMRALNQREVYHREAETVQLPGPGRCQVIECGTTEERERERLQSLLRVVAACIQLGQPLSWD